MGFALEERTLFNILDLSKKKKEFVLGFSLTPPKNPPAKFAILPIERSKIDPRLPKEDIDKYLSFIDDQDRKAKDVYDVIVLRYRASNNFTEMDTIIKNIHSKIKARTAIVEPDLANTGVPI
jgi:predicted component of viral defense system (DUF524 family)